MNAYGFIDQIGAGMGAVQSAISAIMERCAVALEIIDDTINTDDEVAGVVGSMVGGVAKTAQKAAVADSDFSRIALTLNGQSVDAAYIWGEQSNSVKEINPAHLIPKSENLIGVINLPIGVYYYPSENGFDMFGRKDISIISDMEIDTDTMTFTFEVRNGNSTWKAITIMGVRTDTGETDLSEIAVTDSAISFSFDLDSLNYDFTRIKIDNEGATNVLSIDTRRKSL